MLTEKWSISLIYSLSHASLSSGAFLYFLVLYIAKRFVRALTIRIYLSHGDVHIRVFTKCYTQSQFFSHIFMNPSKRRIWKNSGVD
jgi:hypothetical protein